MFVVTSIVNLPWGTVRVSTTIRRRLKEKCFREKHKDFFKQKLAGIIFGIYEMREIMLCNEMFL